MQVSQQNQLLGDGVMAKVLELIDWELEEHEGQLHGDFMKFGTATALVACALLRGSGVFLLDLAGL